MTRSDADRKKSDKSGWNTNFWNEQIAQVDNDNALKSVYWNTQDILGQLANNKTDNDESQEEKSENEWKNIEVNQTTSSDTDTASTKTNNLEDTCKVEMLIDLGSDDDKEYNHLPENRGARRQYDLAELSNVLSIDGGHSGINDLLNSDLLGSTIVHVGQPSNNQLAEEKEVGIAAKDHKVITKNGIETVTSGKTDLFTSDAAKTVPEVGTDSCIKQTDASNDVDEDSKLADFDSKATNLTATAVIELKIGRNHTFNTNGGPHQAIDSSVKSTDKVEKQTTTDIVPSLSEHIMETNNSLINNDSNEDQLSCHSEGLTDNESDYISDDATDNKTEPGDNSTVNSSDGSDKITISLHSLLGQQQNNNLKKGPEIIECSLADLVLGRKSATIQKYLSAWKRPDGQAQNETTVTKVPVTTEVERVHANGPSSAEPISVDGTQNKRAIISTEDLPVEVTQQLSREDDMFDKQRTTIAAENTLDLHLFDAVNASAVPSEQSANCTDVTTAVPQDPANVASTTASEMLERPDDAPMAVLQKDRLATDETPLIANENTVQNTNSVQSRNDSSTHITQNSEKNSQIEQPYPGNDFSVKAGNAGGHLATSTVSLQDCATSTESGINEEPTHVDSLISVGNSVNVEVDEMLQDKSTNTIHTSNNSKFNVNAPEFKLDAPEFRLDAPEFKLDAPEFKLEAPEFKLDAPELKVDAPEFRLDAPAFNPEAPEFNPTATQLSNNVSPGLHQELIAQALPPEAQNLAQVGTGCSESWSSAHMNTSTPEKLNGFSVTAKEFKPQSDTFTLQNGTIAKGSIESVRDLTNTNQKGSVDSPKSGLYRGRNHSDVTTASTISISRSQFSSVADETGSRLNTSPSGVSSSTANKDPFDFEPHEYYESIESFNSSNDRHDMYQTAKVYPYYPPTYNTYQAHDNPYISSHMSFGPPSTMHGMASGSQRVAGYPTCVVERTVVYHYGPSPSNLPTTTTTYASAPPPWHP
ncbi:hypothetical protein EC973_006293 [Apophysomyces ossiformis]|uniref:Uncharacterized protein n=1 Tax=Apophysomyces ossiformis TaxID=679940 RepID=A0A8H7BRC7_9FUNG|nr:hypothetical protein EC973_006293 [Apophysomyces ossiformis]